jgi:hypothetical protein
MNGMRQAAQSAAAYLTIETPGTRIRRLVLAKGTQNRRIEIEFLERTIENIPRRNWHATAGTKGPVGKNRKQGIPGRATVGFAASDKELEGTVHGDLRSAPRSTGSLSLHCFEKPAGFLGG